MTVFNDMHGRATRHPRPSHTSPGLDWRRSRERKACLPRTPENEIFVPGRVLFRNFYSPESPTSDQQGGEHLASSFFQTCLDLVIRPAAAFRAVSTDPPQTAVLRYSGFFLITFALLVLGAVISYQHTLATYPGVYIARFEVLYGSLFVQYAAFFTAGILLFCLFCHTIVLAAGGRGGPGATWSATAYAVWPVLAVLWLFMFITWYGMYINQNLLCIFCIWALALLVIGIRELHGLPPARAALPVGVIIFVCVAWYVIFIVLPPKACGGMC